MANTKVAVFGASGNIGGHFVSLAPRYDLDVALTVTGKKGIVDSDGKILLSATDNPTDQDVANQVASFCRDRGVRYAVHALPSGGRFVHGVTDATHAKTLIAGGMKCVFASKSMFANNWSAIQHPMYMRNIGLNAALGGGTGMPNALRYGLFRHSKHGAKVAMVCNATINFILSKARAGYPLGVIGGLAVNEGYAERPKDGQKIDLRSLIEEELEDALRKIALMLNTFMGVWTERVVDQWLFKISPFTERDLRVVTSPNSRHWYLVCISTDAGDITEFESCVTGGRISKTVGKLQVEAGFVNVAAGSPLDKWLPTDAGNAIVIDQNDDSNTTLGTGAGKDATVGAVMSDLGAFIRADSGMI